MVKLADQIALASAVTGNKRTSSISTDSNSSERRQQVWKMWYWKMNSRDVQLFVSEDLRSIVGQFNDIWNVRPPADDSNSTPFSVSMYEREIRKCIKNCGMAPRRLLRRSMAPLTRTVASKSNCNEDGSSRKVTPEHNDRSTSVNLNHLFRFITLRSINSSAFMS